jgi:endogenous inhibitor of DNA gyrase (YacG/DUF329 family)
MMAERVARCPICREPAPPRGEGSSFPFCDARCQLLDLGHWLNGDYRIQATELEGYQDAPGQDVD